LCAQFEELRQLRALHPGFPKMGMFGTKAVPGPAHRFRPCPCRERKEANRLV